MDRPPIATGSRWTFVGPRTGPRCAPRHGFAVVACQAADSGRDPDTDGTIYTWLVRLNDGKVWNLDGFLDQHVPVCEP